MQEWWGCSWKATWMDLSQAFPAAAGHTEGFIYMVLSEKKDAGVHVCLHLPAFLSSLFHSLYFFFLCLRLNWMTSLCKCGTLVFKARKAELRDGCRWVFLSAEAPSDVPFRCALESDRNCVTFAAAPEEWEASCQIRTKQHGYVVFLDAKLLNSI